MPITLDISPEELAQLDMLSKDWQVTPNEIAQEAISNYLKSEVQKREALDRVFGMWADREEDGLAYQLRMRAEWDRTEF